MKHSWRDSGRRRLVHGAGDFLLALGLFWGLAFTASAAHGKPFIALSLIFAAMATLNLAFLRHLRRVYASPRRGVWRRV